MFRFHVRIHSNYFADPFISCHHQVQFSNTLLKDKVLAKQMACREHTGVVMQLLREAREKKDKLSGLGVRPGKCMRLHSTQAGAADTDQTSRPQQNLRPHSSLLQQLQGEALFQSSYIKLAQVEVRYHRSTILVLLNLGPKTKQIQGIHG